jgi:predicted RNA-binding Zn-ribbon protein involved in translation (DUF1610 family)
MGNEDGYDVCMACDGVGDIQDDDGWFPCPACEGVGVVPNRTEKED